MDNAFFERMKDIKKQFGKDDHAAVTLFDDIPRYPVDKVVGLTQLQLGIYMEADAEKRELLITEFISKRDTIKPKGNSPERIYLWPEGNMPKSTVYTDNSDYRYNHDPDFKPYMFEMLIPEDIDPKGAVVVIPGGDHGMSSAVFIHI